MKSQTNEVESPQVPKGSTEFCVYCGADLPVQPDELPIDWVQRHDWRAEREIHNEGCEWVETKAHTLPHDEDYESGL